MGAFFRGWRRKFGCMTLVMACVFMAGWVRSHAALDGIYCRTTKNDYSLASLGSTIHFMRIRYNDQPRTLIPSLNWFSQNPSNEHHLLTTTSSEFDWQCKWQIVGFGIRECSTLAMGDLKIWVVPYWSVVLPLTLISFWLLLSKPRKSTPKKLSEPTENEGA